MPTLDDNHTGARIKEQRRLARLTQRQMADLLPYSYSLLNQVECGARPATADFVAACAKVLSIDVTALTGQPYVTELQRDRLAELVRPIRESLDLYDLGRNPDLTARPADQLISAADRLCEDVRATHLRKAARQLPSLIAELTHMSWSAPSTELWKALASAYRTAHDISVKLGYYDLSSVALDRMDWAAQRASSPCLAAVRQNERWVADFTYVATWSGIVYVAFVVDVFSRAIVGWSVATSKRAKLVLDALDMALWRRDRAGTPAGPGLVHHSDAGSQYTSFAFTAHLIEAGIDASIGTVGDALDNALMESQIGLYKTELIKPRRPWHGLADVELATAEWVDWFNNQRLHTAIGDIPPYEHETNHYAQHQPQPAAGVNA
ncbi:IS3 family transposase [Streptomyces sp. B93]|uniref:IS3 family transposase n=1 Tax=Streptomyces sp. B93 TaxID=2824875 RepID=UPI001B35860D|nr:IS3 family transposase [Streptomyces sp. B93]MBQ1090692.1 IS3 family transposase [Streptomyces sp. B93]